MKPRRLSLLYTAVLCVFVLIAAIFALPSGQAAMQTAPPDTGKACPKEAALPDTIPLKARTWPGPAQPAELPAELASFSFPDPRNPDFPDLIQPDPVAVGVVRLDPHWEVAEADFRYTFVTLGDAALDQQSIRRAVGPEGGYIRDCTEPVSAKTMAGLVGALSGLVPSQLPLTYMDHTDDYPQFAITLLGTDGRLVTISSTSNSNPGLAPWNILVNGRYYVSFDIRVAAALQAVFRISRGVPTATFSPGSDLVPGEVGFFPGGGPNDGTGVEGLTLLDVGAGTQLDFNSGTLSVSLRAESTFQGRNKDSSAAKVSLTDSFEILTLGGAWIHCPYTGTQPYNSGVTCTLGAADRPREGNHYYFPVRVAVIDRNGYRQLLNGAFYGVWGRTPQLPLTVPPIPAETIARLQAGPGLAAILANYVPLSFSPAGAVDPTRPDKPNGVGALLMASRAGQAPALLLSLSISISDGQPALPARASAELANAVTRIRALPFITRIVKGRSTLFLDVEYQPSIARQDAGTPQGPQGMFYRQSNVPMRIVTCNGKVATYPNSTAPGVSFSFNSFSALQSGPIRDRFAFALTDDAAIVTDFRVDLNLVREGDLRWALLPEALHELVGEPVSIDYGTLFEIPEFSLRIDSSAPNVDALAAKIEALPFAKMLSRDGKQPWWRSNALQPVVQPDGSIAIQQCTAPSGR